MLTTIIYLVKVVNLGKNVNEINQKDVFIILNVHVHVKNFYNLSILF